MTTSGSAARTTDVVFLLPARRRRPVVRPGRSPYDVRHAAWGDPQRLTRRLAQAIAEVLAGVRPARQLGELAAPEVVRQLCRNAGRLAGRPGARLQRPLVDSVHVREPCPGVAEACAVIDTGLRKRALALRLEADGPRWRCTAVQLG